MTSALDSILVLVLLLNLFALGASRLRTIVVAVAIQGVLLAFLPSILHREMGWSLLLVSVGALLLKGIAIPRMLIRALADLPIRREVEPLLGFRASLILGGFGT